MKRIGNLYHKIYDIENIRLAHKNARKNKTHYTEVKEVDANEEYYFSLLSDMLKNKQFTNSQYDVFTKNDKGKERTIYKLPYFPDRIVQHAILQVLEPIWKKILIANTYQSIKGRGIHKAKKDVIKAIKALGYEDITYGQLDIAKYYPSVDNEIMEKIVAKKIKCKDTIWLLSNIIQSMQGLPIGNYLSQYLGNLYLSYLDHYVKEVIKVRHYFRYCDDIVILDTDKDKIESAIQGIVDKLKELNLDVKADIKVRPLSEGLDFLGFVFHRRHILLRKRIAKSFKKAVKEFRLQPTKAGISSIISYNGWVVASDSYNLWNKYINPKLRELATYLGYTNKVLWR
jgi:hypothetical protein